MLTREKGPEEHQQRRHACVMSNALGSSCSRGHTARCCAVLHSTRCPSNQRMIRAEGFRPSLLVFISILSGLVVTPPISSGSKLLQLPRDNMARVAPNRSSIDNVREDVIDDLTISAFLPLSPSPYSLNWERRRRFSLLNEKWKGRNCPQITVLDLVCRRLKLLIVVNVEKILDVNEEEIPIIPQPTSGYFLPWISFFTRQTERRMSKWNEEIID
ncbi:hypothetical protein PRIPAC_75690 [Pristionchus pacificus]|uniref:Uncharacterized protein n=1 Tax=Pristionchus pacificus TaxID=54126 RepID=A0A2A6CA33_PRIPA|nr:hypothetical protein PRIPAC_75690 [Pristionchus pacificus]|eukprot:PDM74913.1 hypothetical protein PRIPAC_40294 [Pristionchus pacificus]